MTESREIIYPEKDREVKNHTPSSGTPHIRVFPWAFSCLLAIQPKSIIFHSITYVYQNANINRRFLFNKNSGSHAQRNGTFWSDKPDPSDPAFGSCNFTIQKSGTGNNRDIIDPTDRNVQTAEGGPPLKLVPNIPRRSDQTEIVCSI